jgi:hypothetical protein
MGKKGSREEHKRIINMAEAVDLELDEYTPAESIERATAIMRRIDALAKYSKREQLVVFERLPVDTQETIAQLFEDCRFDDSELTGHLTEPMRNGLEGFRGLVLPYVEVATSEMESIETGLEIGETITVTHADPAMSLHEVVGYISVADAVSNQVDAVRSARAKMEGPYLA